MNANCVYNRKIIIIPNIIMDNDLRLTFEYGKYYNPAWIHYGRQTNVVCDRCKTSNLKVCIGYKSYDLCMMCVHELSMLYVVPKPQQIQPQPQGVLTNMKQNVYAPVTRMLQNIYKYKDKYKDINDVTLMAQNIYEYDNYATRGGNAGNIYN